MAMDFIKPLAQPVKENVERLYAAIRAGKTVFMVFPPTDNQSGETYPCRSIERLEWCLTDIRHAAYAVIGEELSLKDANGEIWDLAGGDANRHVGEEPARPS